VWNDRDGRVRDAGLAVGITIDSRKTGKPSMEMNEPLLGSGGAEDLGSPALKKPYEKPAFRHEKVFVTTALACGKIGSEGLNCIGTNGKVS